MLGGQTPIFSVLVGDEEDTLNAGNFLFEQGFYVQSVTFPAVPYHAGVLRIQVNANHLPAAHPGPVRGDGQASQKRDSALPGPADADGPHSLLSIGPMGPIRPMASAC